MSGWLCSLLVVAASVAWTDGSTLDLHEAVLRLPFLNRTGSGDGRDLFGYSVVLHDTVDPSAHGPGTAFLERLRGAR